MPVPAGSVRIQGKTSGQVSDVQFCGAPSPEARDLAYFVSGLVHRQHKGVLRRRYVKRIHSHRDGETVELETRFPVRWFRPDGSGRRGFANAETSIAVSTDLRGEKLAHTVAHEARHVVQERVGYLHRDADAETAERDAEAYAKKWAATFYQAYHRARGDTSRVHLKRGHPPWYGHRAGDVVISRTTRRAYHYNPRNRGSAWT